MCVQKFFISQRNPARKYFSCKPQFTYCLIFVANDVTMMSVIYIDAFPSNENDAPFVISTDNAFICTRA